MRISFEQLPDDARLWIFASSRPLTGEAEAELLATVDAWLDQWAAHGVPLTCARDWRDGRFLAIAVDQSAVGASGCSIDALFRVLQQLEARGGGSLLGGGRVFYREPSGSIVCTDRTTFAKTPGLTDDTPVFDTSLVTAGAYRASFERPLGGSWQERLQKHEKHEKHEKHG